MDVTEEDFLADSKQSRALLKESENMAGWQSIGGRISRLRVGREELGEADG